MQQASLQLFSVGRVDLYSEAIEMHLLRVEVERIEALRWFVCLAMW